MISIISISQSFLGLTLSLLGTWKPGYTGGGLIWPPFKSHVWCPNMMKDASLKALQLYFENLQKITNLHKFFFFCEFQLFSKKCLQKSPWLIHVNFAKKIAKFKIWALLENIFSYVHCMHIDFLWSYCFSWNLSKSKVLIYSGHLYDVFSSYIAYLISVEVLLSGIVSEFLECLSISFLVWTEYILVK